MEIGGAAGLVAPLLGSNHQTIFLRNDIETLGMEEVMAEGEEVPDPARWVGALE